MSIRCKVCNTPKILNVSKLKSNTTWECQTCGNQLDAEGHVVTLEKSWFCSLYNYECKMQKLYKGIWVI